jgi:hypothetical protein
MSLRDWKDSDADWMRDTLKRSGLDDVCLPDKKNALFLLGKAYVDDKGQTAMIAATKVTGELYLVLDHEWSDAPARWAALQELRDAVVNEASARGFDCLTLFCPPDLEKSFSKRLIALGFIKSPWQSYSLIL